MSSCARIVKQSVRPGLLHSTQSRFIALPPTLLMSTSAITSVRTLSSFTSSLNPFTLSANNARSISTASPSSLTRSTVSGEHKILQEGKTSAPGAYGQRIVILGSGWGGYSVALLLAKHPDATITVISPANHFVFTPLLPSTATGTLEFRAIQEPIRNIKNVSYVQGKARGIDFVTNQVFCSGLERVPPDFNPDVTQSPDSLLHKKVFSIPYDKLIISAGVKTNTFNIPNVEARENKEVFFLKHLHHARNIRDRTLEMFEIASLPVTSDEEKKRLLSFVVVGGGPTSCEYAAELHDFIKSDLNFMYPKLMPFVRVTVVEASGVLLGPFAQNLQSYVSKLFQKRNISVLLKTSVKGVEVYSDPAFRLEATCAVLSDGTKLPFGTMIWSAGVKPVNFLAQFAPEVKSKTGRLRTDKYLRVLGQEGKVWAIGDCAEIDGGCLPQLAQVAQQQASYVSNVLTGNKEETEAEFKFYSLGSMASLGSGNAVFDGTSLSGYLSHGNFLRIKGLMAWIMWRSAYWGKQVSFSNKVLIPMFWLKTMMFRRDVSRF